MQLKPALRAHGRLFVGDPNDSHISLGQRHGLPHPPETMRGFSPDGKTFLTRQQALGFVKRHMPEVYARLPIEAQEIGLHSEHLADALGIEQKKAAQVAVKEVMQKKEPELSNKTAIVYDRGGLYLYAAEKLAEKFKKVYYFLADADAYPSSQKHSIGTGLTVDRVHNFWAYVDKCDIIYFFDCYDGELQHWLRGKGYVVFGSGRGEQIEIDKIKFLETLEELELPCPKTYVADGLDDLLEYLEKNDNQTLFLKNLNRGDFESRKFSSLAQSKPFFDDLKHRLGPACETLQVLVQHKIDAACEVGYDGFQVDGEFTDNCLIGYEIKDEGFVAKIFPETPEIAKQINDAFTPVFKKLGYRGNYSTELRVTKEGVPYYIDCTARIPSPPGELMCEMYGNWAEATWDIAHGKLPKLEPLGKYGAEIIFMSPWHDQHTLHVKFPKKHKSNVKLKNHMKDEAGEFYCIPNGNGGFFGAAIAYADTLKEAIDKVLEVAETVEADELKYDAGLFKQAQEQIDGGEKFGLTYG